MPSKPSSAVAQKKIASMMTIGCSPVRLPMIFGVRKYDSVSCATQKTPNAPNSVRIPPEKNASGRISDSPTIVPRYGTMFSIPMPIPITIPPGTPSSPKPTARISP